MKTKEELIKEAWGKHWETLTERGKEQALEDSGYCNKNYVNSVLDCEIEVHSFPDTDFIRPKSIAGIENNNGWIRIESEEDLPNKEYGHCFMVLKGNIIYGGFRRYSKDTFYFFNSAGEAILQSNITHYQLIEAPKPPIY